MRANKASNFSDCARRPLRLGSAVKVEHLIPPSRAFMHVQRARFTFESTRLFDSGFGHFASKVSSRGSCRCGDAPRATLGGVKEECPGPNQSATLLGARVKAR